MFLRNTTKDEITNVTALDGYSFTIPADTVFAINDEAGKFLQERYRIEAQKADGGGSALPVILPATREEWDKKTFAQVTRFQINYQMVPSRNDMIKICQRRGVDKDKLDEFKEDEGLDSQAIAEYLNKLPVPEDIRFPEDPDASVEENNNVNSEETNA